GSTRCSPAAARSTAGAEDRCVARSLPIAALAHVRYHTTRWTLPRLDARLDADSELGVGGPTVDWCLWRSELTRMEAALRPIATHPVDISEPDWMAKLARASPLDDAGVRGESDELLLDLLREYAVAGDADRAALRALVDEYPSYFWATRVP